VLLAVALIAVVAQANTGHSAQSSDHDVAIDTMVFHLVGISLWVGGLVAFLGLARQHVQHLQVIARTQQTQHIYLDAETNLEIRIVSTLDGRKFEQELSDYREVEGVKFPFKIKMLVDGVQQSQINVQSVEFNVKMDDAMFKVVK